VARTECSMLPPLIVCFQVALEGTRLLGALPRLRRCGFCSFVALHAVLGGPM
jgi:hypothetical protein